MALLVQLMGAERTLEIGVFTGYSSLSVALALPPNGRIVACDISEEYTSVARQYWKEAGVDHKIDLRIKPAMETLDELLTEGQRGRFDFAFIDANKTGYEGYYERCLELSVPVVDNGGSCRGRGGFAIPRIKTEDTVALRIFNKKLLTDSRIALSMLPVGDGITLALKRRSDNAPAG